MICVGHKDIYKVKAEVDMITSSYVCEYGQRAGRKKTTTNYERSASLSYDFPSKTETFWSADQRQYYNVKKYSDYLLYDCLGNQNAKVF